jgi:hypothetical protein
MRCCAGRFRGFLIPRVSLHRRWVNRYTSAVGILVSQADVLVLHRANEAAPWTVSGLDSDFSATARASIAELELIFHLVYSNRFFVILRPLGEGSEWLTNEHPKLSVLSNNLRSNIGLQCFGYLYVAIGLLVVLQY